MEAPSCSNLVVACESYRHISSMRYHSVYLHADKELTDKFLDKKCTVLEVRISVGMTTKEHTKTLGDMSN